MYLTNLLRASPQKVLLSSLLVGGQMRMIIIMEGSVEEEQTEDSKD